MENARWKSRVSHEFERPGPMYPRGRCGMLLQRSDNTVPVSLKFALGEEFILTDVLPGQKSLWALIERIFIHQSWRRERNAIPTV